MNRQIQIICSTEYLVSARDSVANDILLAWEDNNKQIVAVWVDMDDYELATTTVYKNMEDFVRDVVWEQWHIDGVQSDDMKKMIYEIGETDGIQ